MGLTLVDSDILIDAGKEDPQAIETLEHLARSSELGVSVITKMELVVGCRNRRELQILERFLRRFQVVAINEAISRQALDLVVAFRLSHGLLIPDALIAATALAEGHSLITKNQRHYRFIPGLSLLPYSPRDTSK